MAQQTINVGGAPNDTTGDTLRASFQKCNANFGELYGTVFADAPADGKTYGRKDHAWSAAFSVTGGNLTGPVAIIAPNPALTLYPSAVTTASLVGYNGASGQPRWSVILNDGTTESGSNAGANFAINRYADAGVLIDSPITISRATGAPTLAATPAVG